MHDRVYIGCHVIRAENTSEIDSRKIRKHSYILRSRYY